jgi:hypothetical protein
MITYFPGRKLAERRLSASAPAEVAAQIRFDILWSPTHPYTKNLHSGKVTSGGAPEMASLLAAKPL